VWVCTRQQIATHWREVHPFRGSAFPQPGSAPG
jgi:hypothetical protein